MNAAQAAWCALTGAFLAAAVVLLSCAPSATPAAVVCLVVAVTGWMLLCAMIVADRR